MGATQEQIVEALVVACAKSPLGLGPDVLRMSIRAHRDDVVRGSTVMLEPVWSLLAEQGLDKNGITNAMCRFKTWEGRMGVAVMLPRSSTITNAHPHRIGCR